MGWQRLNSRRNSVSLCLFREQPLGFVSVSLALSVLLVRILYCDLLAHNVLVVHIGDGRIRGLEIAVRDEAVALGLGCDFVARDLGRIHQRPELSESVVQCPLVHAMIEVTNEQFCADFDILLLVRGGLVDAYPTSV